MAWDGQGWMGIRAAVALLPPQIHAFVWKSTRLDTLHEKDTERHLLLHGFLLQSPPPPQYKYCSIKIFETRLLPGL